MARPFECSSHAVGEDAVEVLRDHDGEVGASAAANLLQQVALWVQLFSATHGPVQAEVHAVGIG